MRLGRHMPKSVDSLRRAHTIGCEAVQLFVTNPRGWQAPAPNPAEELALRTLAAELDIWPVVVHAAYIINLAAPRDDVFEKSVTLLTATLDRAARVGATEVVFHIGSHVGQGEAIGLARLADGVRRVLAEAPGGVRLLLENDTGGGGKLGYCFENLATTLERVGASDQQLGVCLDTAHLWGAGFDISTAEGVEATLAQADRILGLGHITVLHVNDAREALGSHRDIHARIGEGTINPQGIAAFLRFPALAHTTALLETPYPELRPGEIDWTAEAGVVTNARALAGLAPVPIMQSVRIEAE